ncbi:MAG: prepilin-type N-terminal cleavage/methylation domain-containing protein [Phycisphaerae bacterium]|nr:prepilin-type N-terminal cleavage/methylation domain-containing protein [Phycisphaerae bacterium]
MTRHVLSRPGQRVGKPDRAAAFTLIELLVVVSIIALLISILLPSLKKARDQAKDTACKANLRSMGQAFMMYAERYNNVWPPVTDLFNTNRWPVPFHWGKLVSHELGKYDGDGKLLRGGGPSIFLCPSEKAPRMIANWNPETSVIINVDRVEVGGSFAYSAEIHRTIKSSGEEGLEYGYDSTHPPFLNRLDWCKRPGEIISVMGNDHPLTNTGSSGWRFARDTGYAFWMGYRDSNGIPATAAQQTYRVLGGRHGGKGNALHIDGHVVGQRPDRVKYDQVSWKRWTDRDNPPPGGI